MASGRLIGIVAAVALSSSVVAADLGADDRSVITTVLEHFANRTDAHFYDDSAKLAVWPRTERVRSASFGYDYFNQGEGHCAVERALYESYVKRNAESRSVGNLLGESEKWRRVLATEEKTVSPAFPPPPGIERKPIKTLVTLTRPAYSRDGSLALVVLRFNWSIHGAEARYVVKRSDNAWAVQCSQLVFYP
jgi:hypothetical protein